MQPTQKPVTDQVAAEDTDPFGDLFFGTANRVESDSADVWAEIELDRYLSANEARDLAEVGNDGNLPLGYGCSVCGPEEYCHDDAIERQWEDYDGETEDTDGEIEANELPSDSTSTVPAEPVSRVLRDVVLYLSRHGWCQGAYFEQTATVFTPAACTVGAIGMVCYGGPVEVPAEMVGEPGFGDFEAAVTYLDWCLADWFGVGPDGGPMNAYSFNDARGRTVDEVVAVLRAAASMWDLAGAGIHHADYPHTPGTLYDCPLCESMCFCATGEQPCVYCAIQAELSAEDAATEAYLSAFGDTNGGAA